MTDLRTHELRTLDPRTDPAWLELARSERGSLFGSPPWFTAIADTYGFDLAANVLVERRRPAACRPRVHRARRLHGQPRAQHALLRLPRSDLRRRRRRSRPRSGTSLVDPLLARGLPFQLRVLDADAPRRDDRFVKVNEMAWHLHRPQPDRRRDPGRRRPQGPPEHPSRP